MCVCKKVNTNIILLILCIIPEGYATRKRIKQECTESPRLTEASISKHMSPYFDRFAAAYNQIDYGNYNNTGVKLYCLFIV